MTEYRRVWLPGATWCFTVNLAEQRGNRLLVERIDVLRTAFRSVRARHPFQLEAVVILPDHLHCVWTLASGDSDFSTHWSLIKGHFSHSIEKGERVSQSRTKRRERGLCQRISSVIKPTQPSRGLCPSEPGETRMGETRIRLVSFQFPCVQAARNPSGGLGWPERPSLAAVTRVMRFPSVTASYNVLW